MTLFKLSCCSCGLLFNKCELTHQALYIRGRETPDRGQVLVREEIVTGTGSEHLIAPKQAHVSLNQGHDDLRDVINLHVPNIHYFVEDRSVN